MKNLFYLIFISVLIISSCKKEDEFNRNLNTYEDWMTDIIVNHKEDVSIKDIAMPGAHDAGTYVLTSCSFGANECNTQTQNKSTREMLERGVRSFDIRPMIAENDYFTQHVTDCGGLGCRGDYLSNMFEETKTFLDNHSELVIYFFTHFCDTGYNDSELISLIQSTFGDRLYTESSPSSSLFMNLPLRDIVDINAAKGKVLILFEDAPNDAALKEQGIFSYAHLGLVGSYSNSYDLEYMKNDQAQKFNNFDENSNNIFEMSWTMTLDATLSVACALNQSQSIEFYATGANNDLIPSMNDWISNGTIRSGKIPNIIWVDFADTFVADACFRINEVNIP